MANEAYRAVFLRVHPTGKMVLSLTTESDGREAEYAQTVAEQLGVPPLDVKVVPADTDRFGEGHGFNTSPSDGTVAAISSASGKIRDKAQLLAGMALDAPAESLEWSNGAFVNAAAFPAVPGMVALEKKAIAHGYKVFFLTGRPGTQRAGTVDNLVDADYAGIQPVPQGLHGGHLAEPLRTVVHDHPVQVAHPSAHRVARLQHRGQLR